MRKTLALLLCLVLTLLVGCGRAERYSYDFYETFDTRVRVIGYANSRAEFDAFAKDVHARMAELHRLFDIYHDYSDINNLKTVNDNAGIAPVKVDPLVIELLSLCLDWYPETQGAVNIALGPVLAVWRRAGEEARLPETAELEAASSLCDIGDIIVDEAAGTVYLAKEGMRLDVGAAAKGFAVEVAARELDGGAVTNFLISAGGNVLAQGAPTENGREDWSVGIQNPFFADGFLPEEPIHILHITGKSAVTSGDYQRFYEVDGKRIHHIIDPGTLAPAEGFRSVTVIGRQSGVADILSTALFILPYEEGRALAEEHGYEAVWILPDGEIRVLGSTE